MGICAIMAVYGSIGGESGIRTHGGRKPTAVFKTAALNHSAISPLSLSYRSGSLTIDFRSMFAPAFGLRSQDCCLEPLGHASVFFSTAGEKTIVIPNPASSGEGPVVAHALKQNSRSLAFGSG